MVISESASDGGCGQLHSVHSLSAASKLRASTGRYLGGEVGGFLGGDPYGQAAGVLIADRDRGEASPVIAPILEDG